MAVMPFGDGPSYAAAAYLSVAGRGLACALLLQAGLTKARRPRDFAGSLAEYTLVPRWAAASLAPAVAYLEIATAALVAAGFAIRETLAAACLLFLAFAAAIAVDLRRRRVIPCGCGVTPWSQSSISWPKAAANVAAALACGVAAATAPAALLQPPQLIGLTVAVAVATSLGAYAVSLRQYAPADLRRLWVERWTRQHCPARSAETVTPLTLLPAHPSAGLQEASTSS
jgi:putative oxidoreductase